MSRDKGMEAEELACTHLRSEGFEIIDRNVHSRFGEIDVIALKERTLHFVEVKSAPDYETAAANITPAKLERIFRTAEVYMQRRGLDLPYVFDAVIVASGTPHLLENITF